MKDKIKISARNAVDLDLHLTIAYTDDGHGNDSILITIGEQDMSLKSCYGTCVDTDLKPDKSWNDVGNLEIEPKYRININDNQR